MSERRNPNAVTLRKVRTKTLQNAMAFVVSEVEACDDDPGICPEDRPAFVALANACAAELRRRRKRIPYKLPEPPSKGRRS